MPPTIETVKEQAILAVAANVEGTDHPNCAHLRALYGIGLEIGLRLGLGHPEDGRKLRDEIDSDLGRDGIDVDDMVRPFLSDPPDEDDPIVDATRRLESIVRDRSLT